MKKYFQTPWTFNQTLFILAAPVILITLGIGAEAITNFTDTYETSDYRIVYILGMFIAQWALILAPLLVITGMKHSNDLKNYGFKRIGVFKTMRLVLGGYLKYIGIIFILSILVLYSNLKIPGFQAQENIIPVFGEDTISIIVAGVIAVVVAPLVEEIFFRGFVLRSLSNKWGIVVGNITTAAIFAVFHMQWQNIIPIFILGLIINSTVIRSKSIVPAIAFHAFNNAVAFVVSILMIKDVIPIEKLAS